MNNTLKKLFPFGLLLAALSVTFVVTTQLAAEELSQQEVEMRRMVLSMIRENMLQSCDGLEQQDCINLTETNCKEMMSKMVSQCIEPVINDAELGESQQCSEKILAQYGITEESAKKCGVDLNAS